MGLLEALAGVVGRRGGCGADGAAPEQAADRRGEVRPGRRQPADEALLEPGVLVEAQARYAGIAGGLSERTLSTTSSQYRRSSAVTAVVTAFA